MMRRFGEVVEDGVSSSLSLGLSRAPTAFSYHQLVAASRAPKRTEKHVDLAGLNLLIPRWVSDELQNAQ